MWFTSDKPAMCSVITTLGIDRNGWFWGSGSGSVTSRPMPANLCAALVRAFVSTKPPRAMLMK